MKTVLILAPNVAPYPGGAEIYISALMEQIVKFDWRVICVTENPPEKNSTGIEYLKLSPDIEKITSPKTVTWREMQFSLLDEIKQLENRNIDIIHVNSMEACILGRIIADQLNVPIVASIHEHMPEQKSFGMGRVKLVFDRLNLDAVIAPSSFYYDRTVEYKFDKRKIYKIIHGVNVESITKVADKRKTVVRNEKHLNILFVGRVYLPKGLHFLIEALGEMKIERSFYLNIVGPITDESYRDEILKLFQKYHMEDAVNFVGAVSPNIVRDYMINSDLMIAPSINEGFGLSIVEAALLNLPVIASRVGGIVDIIEHKKTGLLFEVGNIKSLIDCLKYYINNPEIVKIMSQNGYKKAIKEFSSERMAKETINAYVKVQKGYKGYEKENY